MAESHSDADATCTEGGNINTRYKIYANYHSRNTQYKAAFTLCATANLPDLHPECHT